MYSPYPFLVLDNLPLNSKETGKTGFLYRSTALTKKEGEGFRLRFSPAEFENKDSIEHPCKLEIILNSLVFTTNSFVTCEAFGELLLFSPLPIE